MGYCHYWEVEKEISFESFSLIVADFRKVVLTLDDRGVRLAGPLGTGLPVIDDDVIAFNGLLDCGHPKNEEVVIPFPAEDSAGIGSSDHAVRGSFFGIGTLLEHRTCDGNCSYETFKLLRRCDEEARVQDGRIFDFCKTAFRPYDLAVQCVLLIAKHHLRDRIQVSSGGSDWHWKDAKGLCYAHLGYPLHEFRIDKELGLVLA